MMDRTEGAEWGARGFGPAPENRACGFDLVGAGGGGVAFSATWLYRRSVWVAARRRALPSLSLPTQVPPHSLSPLPPPPSSPTPPADLAATASMLLVAAVSARAPGGWGRESCGGVQEGWWGGKNQRRVVRGCAQAALAPSHRPIRARRRRPAAPPPAGPCSDGGGRRRTGAPDPLMRRASAPPPPPPGELWAPTGAAAGAPRRCRHPPFRQCPQRTKESVHKTTGRNQRTIVI